MPIGRLYLSDLIEKLEAVELIEELSQVEFGPGRVVVFLRQEVTPEIRETLTKAGWTVWDPDLDWNDHVVTPIVYRDQRLS